MLERENRDRSFEKVEEKKMRMEIQVEKDAKQKEWIKKCDGKRERKEKIGRREQKERRNR